MILFPFAPSWQNWRWLAREAAVLGGLLAAFLVLLTAVPHGEPGTFDRRWGSEIQAIPWGDLRLIPRLGSEIGGGPLAFYLAPLVVAGYLAWRREWMLLTALAALFVLHYATISPKQFLTAPRPSPVFGVDGAGGLESFPSGHVQWSVSFWGFVLLLAWRRIENGYVRGTLAGGYALVVAGTMVGRIELGRHWPLDTVAGVLAGLIALRVVCLACSAMQNRQPAGRPGVSQRGSGPVSGNPPDAC